MKANILGVYIDRLSMRDTIDKIIFAVEGKSRIRVITANPELIYKASTDLNLRQLINTAALVTPDGVGVVWGARRLKQPVAERVTGIDLIQNIFPIADKLKWRLFFFGGKPGVAGLAAQKIKQSYPNIFIESEHGYFEPAKEEEIKKKIREFNPDILLVGLGAPKQEYWIANNSDLAAVSIGVGGSFDVLSGVALRAPKWLQRLSLEWLYRLWKEPSRWRRQLVLPKFVFKVITKKPPKI